MWAEKLVWSMLAICLRDGRGTTNIACGLHGVMLWPVGARSMWWWRGECACQVTPNSTTSSCSCCLLFLSLAAFSTQAAINFFHGGLPVTRINASCSDGRKHRTRFFCLSRQTGCFYSIFSSRNASRVTLSWKWKMQIAYSLLANDDFRSVIYWVTQHTPWRRKTPLLRVALKIWLILINVLLLHAKMNCGIAETFHLFLNQVPHYLWKFKCFPVIYVQSGA